ncbi:MAG: NADP-dependent malic enzyme [Candidatus Margulisbacteria bacterium]|nr:NADP-dependent malic enzyme [Candidatus Margulisiibacteriota bacterium]
MDIYEEAVKLHLEYGGKLSITPKFKIKNRHDLSLAYTPGVARVCEEVRDDPERAYDLTIKKNTVAIITDGSAVLGLGNIGPLAALPVMEGKAVLFKEYADVDAIPICLDTQDVDEIVRTCEILAPAYGGINLEDISAPRCFEVERRLQSLDIPVFHDDQHGTAIVLLAALYNAIKLAGKKMKDIKIVINGAGAAGSAIMEMLLCYGYENCDIKPVKDVIMLDSKGIIHHSRPDVEKAPQKAHIASISNKENLSGTLIDAVGDADILVGVSQPNMFTTEMIQKMSTKPIIFAMSNPIPEIMPEHAKEAGAFIVGTGRSDFPNQVNNVLAFPGIFRGALDARARHITPAMKIAAAKALADYVETPTVDEVIPSPLEKKVASAISEAVQKAI